MVDFNIDTSSYPHPAPVQQQNPLETIDRLQSIQGKGIANQRAQLQLMNERYQHVAGYFSTLLGQDEITPKDVTNRMQDLVKNGIVTPEQLAQHVTSMPNEASVRRDNPNASPQQISTLYQKNLRNWLTQQALLGQERHNAMNWYYGSDPRLQDEGGSLEPIRNRMGKVEPTGKPFRKGLPVETPTFIPPGKDAQGNDIGTGRMAPYGEANPISPGLSGSQSNLPIQGSTAPIVPNRVQTVKPPPLHIGPDYSPVNPAKNAEGRPNNLTGAQTPLIGSPPMGTGEAVEGGLKQYQEASANSGKILNRVKPAQQALRLLDPEVIKGLTGTGPIAEKTSSILSALQGVGLVTKGTDRVAQRQELVKNLAGYLSQSPSAQRSDEAQALAAKANANPDYHLLPTLIDVTRRNIARDRIMAAAPLAFKGRTDWHNFTSHNAEFPNSMDERAFMLDSMSDKERNELFDKVEKENKINRDKFKRSYQLAKKLGMFGE